MSSSDRFAPAPGLSRNAVIILSVVLFHAVALWALQTGLLRRAAEIVIPAQVLAEFITPPAPEAKEPPPPVPPPPKPVPRQPVVRQQAPRPVAKPDPLPAPNAPMGVAEAVPAPVTEAPPTPAAPPAPPSPPAPPRIELPSSNAGYLNNPKPTYPAISRRLGEQGKVVLRVFIDAEGNPQQIEIRQSSGYERLDQQALDAVRRWRFVPGKRNGVPEAMWNIVPINFVLE
jgi:protein TonB